MAAEIKKEIELEIAHVLFIDIVGYSKRLKTAPFLGPAPRRSALRKIVASLAPKEPPK